MSPFPLMFLPLAVAATAEVAPAASEAAAVAFDKTWLDPFFAAGPARKGVERFRLEDYAGAEPAFEQAVKASSTPARDRLPARFLLAITKMNLGRWSDAGAIFEDLHARYEVLAPWHAYYAARCRLRRGDAAGALAWSEKVPPRTVPEAETVLVRLDALAALGRWQEVVDDSTRFLERFKQGPRRPEAQFHLGEALEKLGKPAAEVIPVYRRIWAEAPLESWAKRAEERIATLAPTLAPADAALAQPSAQDFFTRGMVYFDRNQNAEAEVTLAAALNATGTDPVLECRARFHRAQSVFKQRQRPRAIPFFAEAEAACRAAGDKDLLVKSLYQGGRCLATAGDVQAALDKYSLVETEHPEHSYADDARLRAAEIAQESGDLAKADLLLGEIPARYPQGDLVGEALFRVAFRAYQAGQDDQALAALDENLSRVPRETIWYAEGRAHYWKGRIYERMKMAESARSAYARAVREYPLSVYAYLAVERLRGAWPGDAKKLVEELRKGLGKPQLPIEGKPRALYGEPGFVRAVELARMGLGNDARRELAFLGLKAADGRDAARAARNDTDPDALWLQALLLDRGRVYAASHAIPRYTLTDYKLAWPLGRGESAWKLAYPRAFPELVVENSRANKVPVALQLAIMREESAFNPRIESFANALGLTQMLVKTAQRFTEKKVTRDTLLEPRENVELGSKFLGFLVDRYRGQVPLAIAGYNAGEGAVDRWLRERGQLPLDEFLETIPYDETRNYTKRVLSSYLAYNWLYEDKEPVPRLSFTLATPKPPEPVRQGRRGRR